MRKFISDKETSLILRNFYKKFPIISHGTGVYLYDTEGKEYIDAVSGAFVVSLGHSNRDIINNIYEQMKRVSYVNGNHFVSESALELSKRLKEYGKVIGLDSSFFLSSGSEAVEAAVKLARQIWYEKGFKKKHKIITRSPSYHGNTLYALSLSGRPHYKECYEPLLSEVITLTTPYKYRPVGNEYNYKEYIDELERLINKNGSDTISALILEPIGGSSSIASIPPEGYMESLQEICKKNNILIIADEVLCGSYRCGEFFASQQVGLKPDILTLGKGINGGYAPLSVLMTRSEHLETIKDNGRNFLHAQTYVHMPIAVSAGLAVVEEFKKQNIISNVSDVGNYFLSNIKSKILNMNHVGCISGKGMLLGVEIVKDKEEKEPFPRAEKVTEKIIENAFERGLILWPNVGHVNGVDGDGILLAPPLITTNEEINKIIVLLKETLENYFQENL